MASETDRQVVATADDGSTIEAYTTVVGRTPDGSFASVDDVVAKIAGSEPGFGAAGYGETAYGGTS